MYILTPKMYLLAYKMYILAPKMYLLAHKCTYYYLKWTKVYLLKRYNPSDRFCTFFFWECTSVWFDIPKLLQIVRPI